MIFGYELENFILFSKDTYLRVIERMNGEYAFILLPLSIIFCGYLIFYFFKNKLSMKALIPMGFAWFFVAFFQYYLFYSEINWSAYFIILMMILLGVMFIVTGKSHYNESIAFFKKRSKFKFLSIIVLAFVICPFHYWIVFGISKVKYVVAAEDATLLCSLLFTSHFTKYWRPLALSLLILISLYSLFFQLGLGLSTLIYPLFALIISLFSLVKRNLRVDL